jgi:hypothetical protein
VTGRHVVESDCGVIWKGTQTDGVVCLSGVREILRDGGLLHVRVWPEAALRSRKLTHRETIIPL